MLAFLLPLAGAADLCRWPKADKPVTTAEGDEVTVNGMVFDVAGEAGHDRFLAVLRLCHAESAIDPFEAWREAERARKTAQVGIALGGLAAAAGYEDARKRERAASVKLRNELWFVLTGGTGEEEEPVVAPKPPPKPTDPGAPTKETFAIDDDDP